MTVAVSAEKSRHSVFVVRRSMLGRRIMVIAGLMSADLFCFAAADAVLHLCDSPPAIALFRGNLLGAPDTVVDLIAIISALFVFARYLVGDYSRRQLFWDGASATTGALLICSAAYIMAVLMLEPAGLPLGVLVWVALIFAVPTARQGMRALLARAGLWHWPTAIVGTGQIAEEVYPVLGRQLALGLDVRWVVPEVPEDRVPDALANLMVIHSGHDQLADALVAAGCRQVILVPDDRTAIDRNDLVDQLIGADIGVAIVPSLRRLPLFGLSTSYFFGKDLLLLQVRNNLSRLPQRILKRGMDIISSCILLLLLMPVFVVIALVIKLEDGGPVFFVQNRVGQWRRDFRFWKFRTMVVDAEAQLARWGEENPLLLARYRASNFKLESDPRVTRIGDWLRRTSLDELPQLINVLLGDMSLVGPRPLLRRELPDYGAVISMYERVKPGITGLWQISGRSDTTFAERISYDEWYIKNWTMWYDIVILLQTAWVLWRGEGAY